MEIKFENDFPNSVNEPFIKTSEQTPTYNCIAWAAGDNSRWYEPDMFGQYYWPNSIPRQYTIEAYIMVYESIGFRRCENAAYEDGYEKVAVFAKEGMPTHAAKQLPDGNWSSKLGMNVDVSHSIKSIIGGTYGNVVQYLKRKTKPNKGI